MDPEQRLNLAEALKEEARLGNLNAKREKQKKNAGNTLGPQILSESLGRFFGC